jgi:hypothetical protein
MKWYPCILILHLKNTLGDSVINLRTAYLYPHLVSTVMTNPFVTSLDFCVQIFIGNDRKIGFNFIYLGCTKNNVADPIKFYRVLEKFFFLYILIVQIVLYNSTIFYDSSDDILIGKI